MPEAVSTFLPLAIIFVVFWMLLIRPTRKRNKAIEQMRRAIESGDRVMLTSGIYGNVTAIDGALAHVEVAEGVVIEIATAAIASKHDAEPARTPDESDAAGDAQRDVRPEEER